MASIRSLTTLRGGSRVRGLTVLTVAMLSLATVLLARTAIRSGDGVRAAGDWPSWRGPLATGVAPAADPPITWSETSNVRWKTALPGRGHSSPIVVGDRVYLTTAIPVGERFASAPFNVPPDHDNVGVFQRHQFAVLALDRGTGSLLWQRSVAEAVPHAGGHQTGSLASASPVADGELVIVSFGSQGLYALDRQGEVRWQKDFGVMHSKHAHGEGSSPALWGESVVVNWDHEGPSFVVALDRSTGDERWRVERNEITTWSSPVIVEVEGRAQVIVNGTNRVRGYDLATGATLWQCGGLSQNVVASPVVEDGVLVAGSSYEKKAMFAVRLAGAAGDITDTEQVLWTRQRGTPYVPSPLLYDGSLYFLGHYQNVLSIVDVVSGRDRGGPFRLAEIHDVYASPVGAAGRVYITDRDGTTLVLKLGAEPLPLAVNHLDDTFNASAAIAGRELFLRGERHLYCLAAAADR